MNETFRNDPILRAVVVVFFGLIVFGFLFGFNFGGVGGPGEMGSSYGYSGSFLGSLISFLIHILMLVLVFALIGGLLAGLRKLYNAQESRIKSSKPVEYVRSSKPVEYISQDPVLKVAAYAFAGILALYFVMGFIKVLFFGYLNPYFLLMALIGFLIKLLVIALVIALSAALFQYAKTNIFAENTTNMQGESTNATETAGPYPALAQSGDDEERSKLV